MKIFRGQNLLVQTKTRLNKDNLIRQRQRQRQRQRNIPQLNKDKSCNCITSSVLINNLYFGMNKK